jgi:hypothetical protein
VGKTIYKESTDYNSFWLKSCSKPAICAFKAEDVKRGSAEPLTNLSLPQYSVSSITAAGWRRVLCSLHLKVIKGHPHRYKTGTLKWGSCDANRLKEKLNLDRLIFKLFNSILLPV